MEVEDGGAPPAALPLLFATAGVGLTTAGAATTTEDSASATDCAAAGVTELPCDAMVPSTLMAVAAPLLDS